VENVILECENREALKLRTISWRKNGKRSGHTEPIRAQVNNIDIAYKVLSNSEDPAILAIMGPGVCHILRQKIYLTGLLRLATKRCCSTIETWAITAAEQKWQSSRLVGMRQIPHGRQSESALRFEGHGKRSHWFAE
jgi:hypothetical protein